MSASCHNIKNLAQLSTQWADYSLAECKFKLGLTTNEGSFDVITDKNYHASCHTALKSLL